MGPQSKEKERYEERVLVLLFMKICKKAVATR